MAATGNIVVSQNGQTLRINQGAGSVTDHYVTKVTVLSSVNNQGVPVVVIQYGSTQVFTAPATSFASPSGTSQQIQQAIAAMLVP